jgi:uncharacterized protein
MRGGLGSGLSLYFVAAKIRTGPPLDEEEDCQLPCWAGEIPLRLVPRIPIPDPRLDSATPLPQYMRATIVRHGDRPKGENDA